MSFTSSPDAALDILKKTRFDALLVDHELLNDSGESVQIKEALKRFWRLYPTLEIFILVPPDKIRLAVTAVKAGAADYLTYPVQADELKFIIDSTYESVIQQSEIDYLRDQFWKSDSLEVVQTRSPSMQEVFKKTRSVAPTKSTVLLVGETGTGKGVLAQLIHRHSNRNKDQFIAVHCGAIPETLIESDLFGHEKGAFTGAIRRKLGKFEIAKGGTIFLDEVGTIQPSTQIKLLQVLQERTFQRVGGEETIEANVRIISATNYDLKELCDSDQFRKDLYYRLNVFPIELPPLRERTEDIPFLAELFLKRLNKFNNKTIKRVHEDVIQAFAGYPWPGNIRELENLMERASILETSSVLTPESFPRELFATDAQSPGLPIDSSQKLAHIRKRAVNEIERKYLKELLARHHGKINASAKTAGISTRQLHKLMAKHGLNKDTFKNRI